MTNRATDEPESPRYGVRALADVMPGVLDALGVPGQPNPLMIPSSEGVCVLLVDGLGWELLRAHRVEAPFLNELADAGAPLTVGFPSTTATSVASLGTGRTPSGHGIVGYTFAAAPDGPLLNALTWGEHAVAAHVDLRETVVPEDLQPAPTAFETASRHGVRVTVAAPPVQGGSGLTRAALRGGTFAAAHSAGDLAARALSALGAPGRVLCYAYYGDLDLTGHARGPGSLAWRSQLQLVDRLVQLIAEQLPAGRRLVVVADHGMVGVDAEDRIDYDSAPELQDGVRFLGGEVRARHVYVTPGAESDVAAAWRATLGGRAWVRTRDEAIAAGWFGVPGAPVPARVGERIGHLVVAMRGRYGLIRSRAEPLESRLIGHHGSLTTAEQLVPILVYGQ